MIPKIFVQTSEQKLESYILEQNQKKTNGYKYLHFNNQERVNFLEEYCIKLFPNIIDTYRNIYFGQHRADLFRYAFLYINGGVYLDTDCLFVENLDNFIDNNYQLITVYSAYNNAIWNGFIAAKPTCNILFKMINYICGIHPSIIQGSYQHLNCVLYEFIDNDKNTLLLNEEYYDHPNEILCAKKDNKILMFHYNGTKIPNNFKKININQEKFYT